MAEVEHVAASEGSAGVVDRAMELIRAAGGRVTTPRVVILQALMTAPEHIRAEDLLALVQDRAPGVHEATVYRTLAALEDLGVVYHVHLGHGASVWHLSRDEHHHLVCERCHGVTHADVRDFLPLQRRVEQRYGFRLRSHFAESGVCAKCAEAARPADPASPAPPAPTPAS